MIGLGIGCRELIGAKTQSTEYADAWNGYQDKFLFSAGQDSGRMASFNINPDSGKLTPLETYPLGNGPCWVSITELLG